MPGYWTLTATSAPSLVVARYTWPIDAAAAASGSSSASTRDGAWPHSWRITFSMSLKETRGASSRSSASLAFRRSRSSGSRFGRSIVDSTWPNFIAAPFMRPSCSTTSSAIRA